MGADAEPGADAGPATRLGYAAATHHQQFLYLSSPISAAALFISNSEPCNLRAPTQAAAAAMAFHLSTAASYLRAPLHPGSSFRRRSVLATAVKATGNSESTSPNPILSSLRHAASAAVLLAATSPALACAPAPTPTPAALTDTVSTSDAVTENDSHPFEELMAETAALVRNGGADLARERLSSAAVDESCARLLAAQTLFVDGKVEEAVAAFEELAREDPSDYRPLFCQGMLYIALGKTEESASALARCRDVAGDKFDTYFSKVISPADVPVADAEVAAEKPEAEEATV
jgi:predicted Zn-dependent protease